MQAYEVHSGETEPLMLASRPVPLPAAGEILIRVRAVSLNQRDLILARRSKFPPFIPASDCAGDIVELGADVSSWKVGDRVVCPVFPTWTTGLYDDRYRSAMLGGPTDGVLAEYKVIPARSPVGLPPTLSYVEAATLPCAGVTAYNALFDSGPPKSGDTVLLIGTGGVSLFALQLALAVGAYTIAISSDAAKRVRLRDFGATHTIYHPTHGDWAAKVMEVTEGVGANVIVDVAGRLDVSLKALATHGMICVIGGLGAKDGASTVSLQRIVRKNAQMRGVYVGSRQHLAGLLNLLSERRIRPAVDRVFRFDEAAAAYAHLASGRHFGKVVITT